MGIFDWFKPKEVESCPTVIESDFSDFKLVTDYIYKVSGITALDKRALASARAQHYAISVNINSTSEFLSKMKSDSAFYQEIINIVTVNETFFLRELKELNWLVDYIKNEKRTLKILSLPCSSGEELYSILLLLKNANIDLNSVEMKGYDINSQAVKSAQTGFYNEHSLHKIEPTNIEKYFTPNREGFYEVTSMFKQKVIFEQKNIFELKDEMKYDVVLSRNMFIYFDNENREIAIKIIANLLKPNGIFIKGHADHIYEHPSLQNIQHGIYKKV